MTSDKYGLTSMAADMEAIGLVESRRPGTPAPAARGGKVPAAVLQMESRIAQQFGPRGTGSRSTVLSRMANLTEGAPAPRRPQTRTIPGATPAGRRRVQESVAQFYQKAARRPAPSPNLRQSFESMARVSALAEEVRGVVGDLNAVSVFEATKGFANIAVISELLARKIHRMGKATNEARLINTARTLTTLAERSAGVAQQLKGYQGQRTIRSQGLVEKFNQGMAVMLAGTQLYSALTEGDDAPFPMKPPAGLPGAGAPGADPFAGQSTPTQAAEGGMPGMDDDPFATGQTPGMPGPAGTGAPGLPPKAQEAMPPGDRDPMGLGAMNPDLDSDPTAEGAGGAGPMGGGDSDPLGLGLGVTPPEQHPGADDPLAMGGQ